jgi:hypothetical protein
MEFESSLASIKIYAEVNTESSKEGKVRIYVQQCFDHSWVHQKSKREYLELEWECVL